MLRKLLLGLIGAALAASTAFAQVGGGVTSPAPTLASLGGLSSTLTSGRVFVGNGSNVATGVALSGDCTMANTGAITCPKSGGVSFGTNAFTSTAYLPLTAGTGSPVTGVLLVNLNGASAPSGATGTGIQLVGTDATIARYEADSFGAIAAFTARRANGTGASPTAIANADQLGAFNWHGYYTSGGAAYSGVQASVQAFATQAWTSTANGTKVVVSTTPNGSTTLTTALTLNSDQSGSIAGSWTVGAGSAITSSGAGGALGTNAFTSTAYATLTTNTFTGLQTLTPSAANQGLVASTGGSNTGSNAVSAVDLSWTLNTSGSPNVVAWRITDTARGGSTKLFNIFAGSAGTTSVFSVDRNGALATGNTITSANNIYTAATGEIGWTNSNKFRDISDGILALTNKDFNGFTRLTLGGSDNTYPAIARNGTVIEIKLADNSAYAQLYGATLRTSQTTVAGLPAAATAGAGARAYVTDALACTFVTAVSGGGSAKCPVVSDGTNWIGG